MVLSMKVGRMPRCSITGMAHIGAATLAVQMPSMSRIVKPASATARCAACTRISISV